MGFMMQHWLMFSILYALILRAVWTIPTSNQPLALSVTISAQTRCLEIQWRNAQIDVGDEIVVTTEKPTSFERIQNSDEGELDAVNIQGNLFSYAAKSSGPPKSEWLCNNSTASVVHQLTPRNENDWITTKIPFDFELSRRVTVDTKCYGYWVSYLDANGTILTMTCVSAHPKWMNEMRPHIENFRLRDLLIPGTHDSGSYRNGFNPRRNETLVTKYSLTQDDDVRGQLMHGIRYLDLRIGYYRSSNQLFWANHGISRQQPLKDILEHLVEFVRATDEIVMIDVQEFPVGFGRTLDIHRKLVNFIKSMLGDLIADPGLTWQATLKDIWQRKQNIILCYDNYEIVEEYPTILFQSAEQRWGNVQNLNDLERFLNRKYQLVFAISSRPVADMAELTPDTWGVLTDSFGGLRFLADHVNRHVSRWYDEKFGMNANIVAVDFYRGTTIVETAIAWNLKRIV